MKALKTIGIFIIEVVIVSLFVAILFYAHQQTVAKPKYPLMHHTVLKGNIPMVIYLEKWKDETDWATCTDFSIIWPACASQGYIDKKTEAADGIIINKYEQIGWWAEGEKFNPILTE